MVRFFGFLHASWPDNTCSILYVVTSALSETLMPNGPYLGFVSFTSASYEYLISFILDFVSQTRKDMRICFQEMWLLVTQVVTGWWGTQYVKLQTICDLWWSFAHVHSSPLRHCNDASDCRYFLHDFWCCQKVSFIADRLKIYNRVWIVVKLSSLDEQRGHSYLQCDL